LQFLKEKLNGDWDYSPLRCTNDVASQHHELQLSESEQRLWRATLINRDTEQEAASLWRNASFSSSASTQDHSVGHSLALLMKQHHEGLVLLGLSTPRLEAMKDAALAASAWGFKVVGSGGGGCGVAWAPSLKASEVASAMRNAGAVNTWIIDGRQPVRGAHIVSDRS
jgi:mevalonate kinase